MAYIPACQVMLDLFENSLNYVSVFFFCKLLFVALSSPHSPQPQYLERVYLVANSGS